MTCIVGLKNGGFRCFKRVIEGSRGNKLRDNGLTWQRGRMRKCRSELALNFPSLPATLEGIEISLTVCVTNVNVPRSGCKIGTRNALVSIIH